MKKFKQYLFILLTTILLSCSVSQKSSNWPSESVPVDVPVIESPKKLTALDTLKSKYAQYLNVDTSAVRNSKLYFFIDRWLYTPYKWGGLDERGIDCSAFIQRLMKDVYGIYIPRTSIQQFFSENIEPFKSSDFLAEGDLVFFRTLKNTLISHVGLYLQNGMFVNASSKGVSLDSLNDPHWKKLFVAAGRIRKGKQQISDEGKWIIVRQ
jgi:lipoprotein Spr